MHNIVSVLLLKVKLLSTDTEKSPWTGSRLLHESFWIHTSFQSDPVLQIKGKKIQFTGMLILASRRQKCSILNMSIWTGTTQCRLYYSRYWRVLTVYWRMDTSHTDYYCHILAFYSPCAVLCTHVTFWQQSHHLPEI